MLNDMLEELGSEVYSNDVLALCTELIRQRDELRARVAELEASRPVWHDAREDLPPALTLVLVSATPFVALGYVNSSGGWHTMNGNELLGVDYWMPIPPTPEVQP